jgi:hypothetical protein
MSCQSNIRLLALLFAVAAMPAPRGAFAQCSGGGGGGGRGMTMSTSGSVSPLVMSTGLADTMAFRQALMQQRQQMYAMQQRLYQQQQQLYARRQQQMQQSVEDQNAQQQKVHSSRLARAEAKLQTRAERIAALKAERDGDKSASTVASTRSSRTFVSIASADSFN